MRHARDADLDRLEDLLAQIRTLPDLKEKKRGVFYRKSRGFLHFHEDPKGMFADLSDPDERIDVTEAAGQARLMQAARQRLGAYDSLSRFSQTWSTIPQALASSAVMKLSRSRTCSTVSMLWPVCLA